MGAWIGLDEMKPNRDYPIILGMNPPNKQGIGIKSKLGSGYDLLQRMKKLWERESEHDKTG